MVPALEARKASNTGKLAARCLTGATIQIVRRHSGPLKHPEVRPGELPLVLFPAEGARPITDFAASAQPIALLVPDGSWSQARSLQQRLRHHTCVTLPPLGESEYRLRAEPQPDGLATFEAIVRALRIVEGPAGDTIATAMLEVFRVMVERLLWFRGKLRDDQVTGGVPPEARANDPRGVATRDALARLMTR